MRTTINKAEKVLSAQGEMTAPKPRAKLNATIAVEIFKQKKVSAQATKVARTYGVSEKAIRDIWTARTWAQETLHLEPSRVQRRKITERLITIISRTTSRKSRQPMCPMA